MHSFAFEMATEYVLGLEVSKAYTRINMAPSKPDNINRSG